MPTSIAQYHAEWLSLIEISGSFLSMPVLEKHFPHGLDKPADEVETRRLLRRAYEEWRDNQLGNRPEPAIHREWVRFVLKQILEIDPDYLQEDQQIPTSLRYEAREYGETLRPDMIVRDPAESQPRLLIQFYPQNQALRSVIKGRRLLDAPDTRMMTLLRATGVRLGLITNGEQWMLVDYPGTEGETTGYYSWYSSLWLEEPLTLAAFRTLLQMSRFFGVADSETLEALLTESINNQQEVTNRLGEQVRHSVEMLIQALDRLDKDNQRELLKDTSPAELYEAAVTVMMRLVFLLFAEENELLRLGEELYDSNYAASTLLAQLQKQADTQGDAVLSLRRDAWSRLLALFRVVYGGVEYPDLRLPAYGGHLFDPDRYPFLEGRKKGTSWRDSRAHPLLIDNLTVLHMLRSLQYLNAGSRTEARRLSFRALDIEQIGHVYEGLLDHTVRRATDAILGLQGTKDANPEVSLDELEAHAAKGESELLKLLSERTLFKEPRLRRDLGRELDQQQRERLMEACDNDQSLFKRILPYAGLLDTNTFGHYNLVTPGSVYATTGSDRRSTGTHYTPRSLTEPMVQHALDPLVYTGPAEGWEQEQWQLHSASELLQLKICDMAMGSGAFLVQTCRYLSEKLVEAWSNEEKQLNTDGSTLKIQIAPDGQLSQGGLSEEILPSDPDERLAVARRIISERCIYGVDKNQMAVEMAKLSLWLTTLAKDKPFTFLDHALRCGDSLLGADESQLYNGSLKALSGKITQISQIRFAMQYNMPTVIQKRKQISTSIDNDITTIEEKERLLKETDQALEITRLGADLLVGIALSDSKRRDSLQGTLGMEYAILAKAYDEALNQRQTNAGWIAKNESFIKIRTEVDELLHGRNPFHWPLEFPEVFIGKGQQSGFSAIISNPPFQGGKKITGALGTDYRDYILEYLANGKKGHADLCAYFFLRASHLTRKDGMNALLATNTIAQGDTREVGLDQIFARGWSIPRAIPSRKWPGEASLEVAQIWLKNGQWQSRYTLNDLAVKDITPFLTESGAISGNPYRLAPNEGKSFIGAFLLGIGFVLEPEEAQALIEKDLKNKDVLFPYLNGEDINSRPDQSPSRWVINFQDWPLERAETYEECMKIVREKVKPQREKQNDKIGRTYWWRFLRNRPLLYSSIKDMKRVLVRGEVSSHATFSWRPTGETFSHMLIVWATEQDYYLALLQSSIHNTWTINYASTLGVGRGIRYTPSDCFETFPFPINLEILEDIGKLYYAYRQSIMLNRQEGLTKTYNRFHTPAEKSSDIVKLRELHKEMDELVAKAYGWEDLKLEHGFYETWQGLRYTISEAARQEVLDRLLALNHQRHAEEVAAGLWDADGKRVKGKDKKAASNGSNGTKPGTDTAKKKSSKQKAIAGDVEQATLF